MKISITGLGYVGLPLALAFAKMYQVFGYDINEARIVQMKKGIDPSNELSAEAFKDCNIEFSSRVEDAKEATFHIIGVPTDINEDKTPNLTPLENASESIGSILKKGDIVVYESTVFPGCTEDICVPILEKVSGLKFMEDFKVGYSPERIVPGDKTRPVTKILKIVSGCDPESTEIIRSIYASIIEAGIFVAKNIKTAEAAKIIENTQRDLNISLMNELSIIFDKLNIDIHDVVEAAGTKWNFHKYYPGLVGGHCIGVDPYYLIHKARLLGIEPEVIAAGRQINDSIPKYIALKLTKNLIKLRKSPLNSRVLVMGVTFKENVSDIRNSKVFDLIAELESYSLKVDIIDPYADKQEVLSKCNLSLLDEVHNQYDAVILCVGHKEFKEITPKQFSNYFNDSDKIIFDIKGILNRSEFEDALYWKL